MKIEGGRGEVQVIKCYLPERGSGKKRTIIGESEAVANMYKSHFSRLEMTSVDAKTMA